MPRRQTDPVDSGGPPPPTDASDQPRPIGVPDDYLAPVARHRDTTMDESSARFRQAQSGAHPFAPPSLGSQAPTYFDGDEWIPASYSANEIFNMQTALAKVGLLRGNWSGGYWDTPTMSAYRELLGMANASGVTDADQLLSRMLSQVQDMGGTGLFTVDENGNVVLARDEGPTRAPLVTRTTDPAALKSVFRRSVIELLGEGWDENQIDQMVSAYNSLEVQRQKEAYDMELTGGSLVDIPSPEAFAEQQVQEQDPEGKQAYESLGFARDFMQLASNTAWGVG